MNFGKNIKKIRAIKKMSQTAFAELFDIKRSSIGAYEEGRAEPKLEVIIRIAEYFRISVDHLVNGEVKVNELVQNNAIDAYLTSGSVVSTVVDFESVSIPLVSIAELTSIKGSDISFSNNKTICLPGLVKGQLALIVNESEFLYMEENFVQNDILLLRNSLADFNGIDKGLYMILSQNKVLLAEFMNWGNNALVYFTANGAEFVDVKNIKSVFPVDRIISEAKNRKSDENKRIEKLEKLVELLCKNQERNNN